MDNLVDLIGKQLTPDVVNALGSLSGTTSAQTQSALQAAVPSVVGALAKQGATPAGAQQILDLLGKQTGGADVLTNLTGLLGNPTSSQNLLSSGAGIVSSLLGGNTSKVVDAIASTAGIPGGAATSILRSVAPLGLAVVGKLVAGGKLDASGLSNLLAGQADFVKAAAPQGLTDALGISTVDLSAAQPPARVPPVEPVRTPPPPPPPKRSWSWLWLLIGALVLLALLWFLFLRPKPQTVQGLPAEVQAPVCAAITNLDQTIKGLPEINANTAIADVQAGRDQVKTAFDGVVNALASVRPAEAKQLQDAYKTYNDVVAGITGSDTVGASAEKVLSARKAVADAEAKLLQGFNCK